MSNAPRLSKSGIEYLDFSWGIYSGCTNDSSVCGIREHCWAMSIVKRFPEHYPNGFDPTWYPEAMLSPLSIKKPSLISVGWVGDMFLDENDPKELSGNFEPSDREYELTNREMLWWTMERCPQHRFLFLTKCGWNLKRWSPFPGNAWVGQTATDPASFAAAYYHATEFEAGLKYISLEPFLNWDERATVPMIRQAKGAGISWLAIGAATRPYRPPKVEWVEDLVWACVEAKLLVSKII